MRTLAQQYRSGADVKDGARFFASVMEWMYYVTSIDGHAEVKRTDLGVVIMFSDGSVHRLGEKYERESE